MSEDLFYNRDNNITGVTVPSDYDSLNLTPVYGSQVQFRANNYSYNTDDNYFNMIPMSPNSLTAEFGVRYDVNETDAKRLATYFENQSGYKPIKFTVDDLGIYKTVSGFCDNYAINFVNNQHFEVAVKLSVDHAPTLFNWSGMGTFTNLSFQGWEPTSSYQKYDIVYSGINGNKLDNFYYCTGDHESTQTNSPTGDSSMWSQKFFFEPDVGTQNDVSIKTDLLEYKNSFKQRLKTNDNIATFNMSYTYSNMSDKQLKCMLHFLENKGGYRRFEHQIPSVYNRPKVYFSPSWTHTWNYANSNTLSVELVEDPLGIIPTGT